LSSFQLLQNKQKKQTKKNLENWYETDKIT
jgi:hypothetical protein